MLKRGLNFGKKALTLNARDMSKYFAFNKSTPCFSFASKSDSIVNILKSEINHEETNYSAVDQNELKTFFQRTKFEFVDKEDSLNMELRKTQGNYEVIINFQAKPPMPQEETQTQQEGEEKSKIIFFIHSAGKHDRIHCKNY
jgi:hypothetical protein